MSMRPCVILLLGGACLVPAAAQERPPIIDMHMHALAADDQGPPPLGMCTPFREFPAWDPKTRFGEALMVIFKKPPCPDPVWSPATDAELMAQTIDVMRRKNIIGVLSGTQPVLDRWFKAEPDRFMRGAALRLGSKPTLTPLELQSLRKAGKLSVLAEISNQYAGILPGDPRMEPYWALCEKLDIPAGIHIGTGPPGAIYLGMPAYRARMHSALTLEEVLVRHPRLRVYIMHAGFPMLDDLLAVLYAHPQVHVDVGVIVFTQPRQAFYRFLQGIVDAGFASRIMFGSDQMVWPGVIERSIAVIEEAPFLTAAQKRAILYDNAARFLRLSEEDKARHRRM